MESIEKLRWQLQAVCTPTEWIEFGDYISKIDSRELDVTRNIVCMGIPLCDAIIGARLLPTTGDEFIDGKIMAAFSIGYNFKTKE